jgi:hypothetical protein
VNFGEIFTLALTYVRIAEIYAFISHATNEIKRYLYHNLYENNAAANNKSPKVPL